MPGATTHHRGIKKRGANQHEREDDMGARRSQRRVLSDLQSTPASLSERLRMEMNGSISEESPATPTGQRRMMETWIVLELCNRGSLQVGTVPYRDLA